MLYNLVSLCFVLYRSRYVCVCLYSLCPSGCLRFQLHCQTNFKQFLYFSLSLSRPLRVCVCLCSLPIAYPAHKKTIRVGSLICPAYRLPSIATWEHGSDGLSRIMSNITVICWNTQISTITTLCVVLRNAAKIQKLNRNEKTHTHTHKMCQKQASSMLDTFRWKRVFVAKSCAFWERSQSCRFTAMSLERNSARRKWRRFFLSKRFYERKNG